MGMCASSPDNVWKDKGPVLNEAVILIKPHCSGSQTFRDYVLERLKENKILIVKEGEWTGSEIREKGVVDKHYGALALRALSDDPALLEFDDNTKEKFESTFGISWSSALESSKIINLTTAFQRLPHLNESQMATAWRASASVKLMPGTYVAKVDEFFVINGFYADMVASWKQDASKAIFFLIQWKEQDLSWADFRGKVVGSTDPAKAGGESVRGTLWKDYQSRFGLDVTPSTTNNGIHASAGPIEGARECAIWSKMSEKHVFLLEKAARAASIPPTVWQQALDNAKISLPSGKKGLLFDVTEGMSADQALEVLKEMSS